MFLEKRKTAVYVVDGSRTPFMKMRLTPGSWSAGELAVQTGKELLLRQNFSRELIDEVILGCVMSTPEEANVARVVGLRLGCNLQTPAWTVHRNCGSGMQALDSAVQSIQSGRSEIVLAGGTEAMSHAPLSLNKAMVSWLGHFKSAKTLTQRLKTILQFRPYFLQPDVALMKGLTDPTVGLNMGQTAEVLATEFNITREAMDAFALASHEHLAKGYDDKIFVDEITPLVDSAKGIVYQEDDGLRRDASLEALARLKPFFDRQYGRVTAGNSSQITDGACLLLLASEKAVKEHNLPILGRIVDTSWAGLEPGRMGLGPFYAGSELLKAHKMKLSDIDFWEINEAFAAQVLGCLAAWKNEIDPSKLNVDGGAIALGHPVGASGARVVLHMLHVLKRHNAKKGVASLCIGGGQGGAMLLERE